MMRMMDIENSKLVVHRFKKINKSRVEFIKRVVGWWVTWDIVCKRQGIGQHKRHSEI